MPIWLLTAGSSVLGFFRKRPILILYAVLAAAGVAFYVHYMDLKSDVSLLRTDNATLKVALTTQKETTEAVKNRAEELAQSFIDFELTIETLEGVSRDIRNENRLLRQRLSDLELDTLVTEQPAEAERIASDEYNASVRLLECETDPSRDETCGTSSDTGTGPS